MENAADSTLFWSEELLANLDGAIARAAQAHPTLLIVQGEPGTGKTAALSELVRRADGFQVLYADGLETGDPTPYEVLAQWGTDIPSEASGARVLPFVAAQQIRRRIDARAGAGPVLLRVDDLQWADSASVEALVWLLRRATVDRLLVAVGTRPLAKELHPGWQKWVAEPAHRVQLTLNGLALADAQRLVLAMRPELKPAVARRLWKHTAGNPLYLRALLDQYDEIELTGRHELPAPAEFEALIATRLDRLPEAGRQLLQAVSVLGAGWIWLPDAATVGTVPKPGGVAESLVRAGLLQSRVVDVGMSVTITHSLIRAAIYQQIPFPQRRELHLRAATVVPDQLTQFDHRIAAAENYDDDLADDLADQAARLHAVRSHRLAARYHRSAGTLTSDPMLREKRWLESLFDSLLGQDVVATRAEIDYVQQATDLGRRRLVLGTLATVEGRWDDAVRILQAESTQGANVPADDPLVEYRRQVLLAWGLVGDGHSAESIAAALDAAASQPIEDPALAGYQRSVESYSVQRERGIDGAVEYYADVPARPADTPARDAFRLAGRGRMRVRLGLFADAEADLVEMRRRLEDGMVDIADGLYIAALGQLFFFTGEWDRARTKFGLAIDASERFVQPMVASMVSMLPSARGDLETADRWLDQAREFLQRKPWPEAARLLMVGDVVRLHAAGSAEQRTALVSDNRGTFDFIRKPPNSGGALEILHAGLAFVWAGDLDGAEWAAGVIERQEPPPKWGSTAVNWLLALAAESRGDNQSALGHLHLALQADRAEMPFYRAHVLADHARLAGRLGFAEVSENSRADALEIYRSLGAVSYVARLDKPAESSGSPSPTKSAYLLSDREREVLRLVVLGFSYAQISRDLFITRSTVGFHLSNIYAKTGVSTRHELTALVRKVPQEFGMLALGA